MDDELRKWQIEKKISVEYANSAFSDNTSLAIEQRKKKILCL